MRELTKKEQYWYKRIIAILNDVELHEPLKGWIIYNINELIIEILKNENDR